MLDETTGSRVKWLLDCQRDKFLPSKPHDYSSQEQLTWYLASNNDSVHTRSFSSGGFNFSYTAGGTPQAKYKYNRGGEVKYEGGFKSNRTTHATNNNGILAEKGDTVDREFGYIPFTI